MPRRGARGAALPPPPATGRARGGRGGGRVADAVALGVRRGGAAGRPPGAALERQPDELALRQREGGGGRLRGVALIHGVRLVGEDALGIGIRRYALDPSPGQNRV